MKKFSVKTIVAIGIGAALFFVLGRFVAIPSPVPNTNIAPSMAFWLSWPWPSTRAPSPGPTTSAPATPGASAWSCSGCKRRFASSDVNDKYLIELWR